MNGDIWAPFPERTEGIFQDSTSFISNSGAGVQTNYAQFFTDLKDVSDYAFSQLGLVGILTGYTGNNYSEVRSGWLQQSIFTQSGVISYDYYQNYDHSGDFRGAHAKVDLDAATTLHGGLPTIWQEWGPTPDMINNISSTSGQAVNGYGSIQSPDVGFAANREVYERDLYTNALTAAYNQGKLIMFNYWGFWDTGENDTGLAKIVGSPDTAANIGMRREGWTLAEYFNQGPQPTRWFTARAYAKTRAEQQVTFTAKASVVNNAPTITANNWTKITGEVTLWIKT
jgi:hypothetical protein